MLDAQSQEKFQTAFQNLIDDTNRQKEICALAKQTGKPEYVPYYMLAHGLGAFEEGKPKTKEALLENLKTVDEDAIWKEALEFGGRCEVN